LANVRSIAYDADDTTQLAKKFIEFQRCFSFAEFSQ